MITKQVADGPYRGYGCRSCTTAWSGWWISRPRTSSADGARAAAGSLEGRTDEVSFTRVAYPANRSSSIKESAKNFTAQLGKPSLRYGP